MARKKGPVVVKFPERKTRDDTEMVSSLVWLLARAREGSVRGYAIVALVESDEEVVVLDGVHTAGCAADKMVMLGAIRRMEHRFVDKELS